MTQFRVILADDHVLVRAGIRKLLESIPGLEVVGEANDGLTAMELVERLKPDLLLIDIAMPGLNGLSATKRLLETNPETCILILSMHQNEDYVRQALRNGASGYLLKDAAPMELEIAVAAVRRKETYLSPVLTKGVLTDYVNILRNDEAQGDRLTPRQREVLQLIAEGQSTKEIGQKLVLSAKTIETHRSQLMNQLNIHDIAGLVRYAIRTGMIVP